MTLSYNPAPQELGLCIQKAAPSHGGHIQGFTISVAEVMNWLNRLPLTASQIWAAYTGTPISKEVPDSWKAFSLFSLPLFPLAFVSSVLKRADVLPPNPCPTSPTEQMNDYPSRDLVRQSPPFLKAASSSRAETAWKGTDTFTRGRGGRVLAERNFKKMSHFAVQQKLAQHCKSTIF